MVKLSCEVCVRVNSDTVKANRYVDIFAVGWNREYCHSSSIMLVSGDSRNRNSLSFLNKVVLRQLLLEPIVIG